MIFPRTDVIISQHMPVKKANPYLRCESGGKKDCAAESFFPFPTTRGVARCTSTSVLGLSLHRLLDEPELMSNDFGLEPPQYCSAKLLERSQSKFQDV